MSGNEELYQQAMNKGHTAAWDQSWVDAATYYRQALEEIPDDPKAHTSLALALYEQKDYEQALIHYKRAAQLSPDDPIPLEKIAEVLDLTGNQNQALKVSIQTAELYAKTGDINKAIEQWTRVTRINPEYLPAHSRLALVYERMGRKQQAVAEYLFIASLYQHAGQVQKAAKSVNQGLKIMPESKEAWQALEMVKAGRPLPKPRRPKGVTGPLKPSQVSELEPPKPDPETQHLFNPIQETQQRALSMLAGLLFELDDEEKPTESRQGIQSIVKGTGVLGRHKTDLTKITLHLSQAIDQQSRNQNDQAIVELEHAIDTGLDNPAAYFNLGFLLTKADRLDDAIRNLQKSVKHIGFSLGARLLIGQTFHKMDRIQDATIEYLEALKIADSESVPVDQSEQLAQLYDPIIESYTQQSDPEILESICSNITELILRPNWRVNILSARKQMPARAEGELPLPLAEMLTEAKSSQVVESLTSVHQLARAGKFRTAMEEAFYAIQYAPTYLPLHITMGDLLLQEDRPQEAVEKFTVIAQNYNVRGEAARAISLLQRVIQLAPMDLEARTLLIRLLTARGQADESIREYLKLAEVYYSLADLSMSRDTYEQALRFTQQSTVDPSWKVTILHRMADIDMQSLDWRRAITVYEQVRSIDPDDSKAREMLIDIYTRLGKNEQVVGEINDYVNQLLKTNQSDQALDFMLNVIEENPDQPVMHRILADVYRQQGRVDEAIEQLDTAGEMLLKSGNRNGAIEMIMTILTLNPPNAADYQNLLNQIQAQ
jgi:tetratricopeptide (TPR) repeat protein